MEYFYSLTDTQGYIHSIDMLYVEWFARCNLKTLLDMVRTLHEEYPLIRYEEYLERPRSSKYDFYLDGIVFGTVFLNMGKYTNYDKVSKTFDIFSLFQLRFNPNKVMKEDYFLALIKCLMKHGSSGYIRKYDYAIDIPVMPKYVKVFSSRKEMGLYKGTRYYGQSGRHNYTKIYDKAEELKKQNIDIKELTRVEYTFIGKEIPSFERVYVLDNDLTSDYSALNDTDIAIIEMYNTLLNFGFDYDLKLGRKKIEKLSKYLYGAYKELDYGNYLNELLEYIKGYFQLTNESDVFIPCDLCMDDDLPFD